MSLVVTGASGQLGRLVVGALPEGAADRSEVVLVTRSPAAAAVAAGAQVRFGDFDDPPSLRAAFAGGDRLLLVSTSAVGRRLEQHRAALAAARQAGVRHVVYTSLLNPSADNPAVVMAEHRLTEEALRDCGMAWTALRNGIYAEHQLPRIAEAAASGRLVHNQGRGRTAYVAREDCAAVAAAVLAGGGHEGETLDVTGPEALDAVALACIGSAVTGAPIAAVRAGDDELRDAGLAAGVPPQRVEMGVTMGQAVRAGLLDGVSDVVRRVTGRAPLPLRAVLEAHAEELLPGA